VFGSYLSSQIYCIAGVGLPIYMMGEVSCEPKRRRA
jgi:hypothetical protein